MWKHSPLCTQPVNRVKGKVEREAGWKDCTMPNVDHPPLHAWDAQVREGACLCSMSANYRKTIILLEWGSASPSPSFPFLSLPSFLLLSLPAGTIGTMGAGTPDTLTAVCNGEGRALAPTVRCCRVQKRCVKILTGKKRMTAARIPLHIWTEKPTYYTGHICNVDSKSCIIFTGNLQEKRRESREPSRIVHVYTVHCTVCNHYGR